MNTKFALGLCFMCLGLLAIMIGNYHFWMLREELALKRPDLNDFLFGGWWHFLKFRKLARLYKQELPSGRRLVAGRGWGCAGIAAWLIGGLVLMNSQ